MKFLDRLAIDLLNNQSKTQEYVVILPSERAKKYLNNALFRANKGPLLSPNIFTIDQWVVALSKKKIQHPTLTLLSLYNVYNALFQEKALSFEDYLSWGPIMLSDFDDIDRYLIDQNQLYQNLSSIKALESWQIDEEEYSESQKKFMLFWELIPKLHRGLQKILIENESCTKAQAYRQLAEQPTKFFDASQYFIFAGFNALSLAEQHIIKFLLDAGQAEFIIDSDHYYYDNPIHEAGNFQRKNISFFGLKPPKLNNALAQENYNVKVIECAQHIGQIKVLATELLQSNRKDWGEVLVLLADESLVHAAIRNIPKTVSKANITLGLPLNQTPVRTWVDLCFQIQENQQKFKTSAIYYKDLQRFCHHAFISLAFDQNAKLELSKLEKHTIQYNRVFQNINQLQLSESLLKLIILLTTPWQEDWEKALQSLRKLNALLLDFIPKENDFEHTALLSFEMACRQFELYLGASFPKMKLTSFKKLFYQHWTSTNLAYLGNPTDGLQMTGLLETRLLDFDQIYVLGMNEGKLPPTNPIQSIIPMDLRKAFKMPSNRDKQGLFAQHFYRLLHHARSVTFTYTTASEVLGSQEKSRYLLQLEMEWRAVNPNVNWETYFYQIPSIKQSQEQTRILKTSAIKQLIMDYFKKGVSASAMRKFISCPLDFYYRYIVEFGEEQEIEEDLESSAFGSLIHECLEELYQPFAQKNKAGEPVIPSPGPVSPKDIKRMRKEFPKILRRLFLNYFDKNEDLLKNGKNWLSYEMALALTDKHLQNDLDFIEQQKDPLFIEQLEGKLTHEEIIQIDQMSFPIKFVGYIDRIDRIGDDYYRVIDYKSGKVTDDDIKMRSDKDAFTNLTVPKHSLQLCLYSMLFKSQYGHLPSEARIQSLINNKDEFALRFDKRTDLNEVPEIFQEGIQILITQLFDENQPFEHNPDSKYCQFCT